MNKFQLNPLNIFLFPIEDKETKKEQEYNKFSLKKKKTKLKYMMILLRKKIL